MILNKELTNISQENLKTKYYMLKNTLERPRVCIKNMKSKMMKEWQFACPIVNIVHIYCFHGGDLHESGINFKACHGEADDPFDHGLTFLNNDCCYQS